MRIEWLPEAGRNFEDQIAYVARHSVAAAIRMGDLIEESAASLVEHPRLGRPGKVDGTRELVVSGTPYVIVYRIEPEVLLVLRLLHGKQQWPPENE